MSDAYLFCSQYAEALGDSPEGSAPLASCWIGVEVPDVWGSAALAESALPPEVKERLQEWDAREEVRVQFIRRGIHEFERPGYIQALVARPDDEEITYLEFESYEDLLSLDIERPGTSPHIREDVGANRPAFLVCTNGKRDRCCARYGRVLYQAMQEEQADLVWQTTHLGGHRYAATMLALPSGICYGRLRKEDGPLLLHAHRQGKLHRLDSLRGRTHWPRPAQAAEYFLRARLQTREIDALRLTEVTEVGDDRFDCAFETAEETVTCTIERTWGDPRPVSCGDDEEKRVASFALATWSGAPA